MPNPILDNPVWPMLNEDLQKHSRGTALARRGDAGMFGVAALADHSDAALRDLAALYETQEHAILIEASPPDEIPGFVMAELGSGGQYVCAQRLPVPAHEVELVQLRPENAEEMAELIALAQPGPFFPAMLPIRHFVGIRQAGQLVAMAGERIKGGGYCEITAVCTHPDWRGKGYASLVTLAVADGIWERGETPYLHVVQGNDQAVRVYERLQFVQRAHIRFRNYVRN